MICFFLGGGEKSEGFGYENRGVMMTVCGSRAQVSEWWEGGLAAAISGQGKKNSGFGGVAGE